MCDHAFSLLGDSDHMAAAEALGEVDRLGALIGLGTAFAVNCTQCFGQLRTEAEAHGVTTAEIAEVVELARMIKDNAASHVERRACGSDAQVTSAAE